MNQLFFLILCYIIDIMLLKKCYISLFNKNIYNSPFIGTVFINTSDPQCQYCNDGFTTVNWKALSDKVWNILFQSIEWF